jgi:D-sedoheptulose 7-phosphate isomerase
VLASGGKVMVCGNGGSAADAQHCAAELVSTLTKGFARPAIAAIALTTDTSFLTAYANDFEFAGVFARQVEALGRPGDALILISTSGQSENLCRAAVAAAGAQMATVGVLGGDGGPLLSRVTFAIKVPGANTQHVQECHTAILHIICALVEDRLYRTSGAP